MHKWLKISHPKHTGRLRPHEYTSYLPLAILLVFLGISLTVSSVLASSPPPQASSIGLTGSMPGAPPKVAATIKSPSSGQHFSTSPVTVTGSCPAGTLVELYKNDIFAGSGVCSNGGSYSFDIDLLIGQNILVARVYDALNQTGPDSNSVTIFYDVLPQQAAPLAPLSFGGQLLINTDAVFRGAFPAHPLNIPVNIIGGSPPYAVNVEWGDTTNNVISRTDNVTFNSEHIYKKPGTYPITLQATDANGRVAFLTVAAIVNGQPGVATVSSTSTGSMNKILVLWPLYTGSASAANCIFLEIQDIQCKIKAYI
jgi:hypothetical protein